MNISSCLKMPNKEKTCLISMKTVDALFLAAGKKIEGSYRL